MIRFAVFLLALLATGVDFDVGRQVGSDRHRGSLETHRFAADCAATSSCRAVIVSRQTATFERDTRWLFLTVTCRHSAETQAKLDCWVKD